VTQQVDVGAGSKEAFAMGACSQDCLLTAFKFYLRLMRNQSYCTRNRNNTPGENASLIPFCLFIQTLPSPDRAQWA
jgi:hypothetical protein